MVKKPAQVGSQGRVFFSLLQQVVEKRDRINNQISEHDAKHQPFISCHAPPPNSRMGRPPPFRRGIPCHTVFIANARSVCQRLLQIMLATLHHHADHARICQSRGALQWQAAGQNAHTLQHQSCGEFCKPVSARKISAPPCRASTPRSPFPTAAVFSDAYCPQQKWAATE